MFLIYTHDDDGDFFLIFNTSFFLLTVEVKANKVFFYGQSLACAMYFLLFYFYEKRIFNAMCVNQKKKMRFKK